MGIRGRKIDDSELLEMFQTGNPQKYIALHFNCSPAAICRRLKRLLPPPESFTALTPSKQRFVKAVVSGKSRTQAALESFDCKDRNSAKAIQHALKKDEAVNESISELFKRGGASLPLRINRHAELCRHNDPAVSLKALDLSYKVEGLYGADKEATQEPIQIQINVIGDSKYEPYEVIEIGKPDGINRPED